MPTFGFSAFLKLLSLNERPQRREVRQRLFPSAAGGYDFHRSLRLLCRRLLVGGDSLDDLIAQADGLTNSAEARSVKLGLESLDGWRRVNPGNIVSVPPRTYESPRGRFKVHFTPDFGLEVDGRVTAIHIWNTSRPELVSRMVYAALSLIPELYDNESMEPPSDFGVLSLPENRLYRLSDVGDFTLVGRRIVSLIENLIDESSEGAGDPDAPTIEVPF